MFCFIPPSYIKINGFDCTFSACLELTSLDDAMATNKVSCVEDPMATNEVSCELARFEISCEPEAKIVWELVVDVLLVQLVRKKLATRKSYD